MNLLNSHLGEGGKTDPLFERDEYHTVEARLFPTQFRFVVQRAETAV
ncbi:MAG: hypothetical protein AB1589_29535 [Cyanobacteriota bacterium]